MENIIVINRAKCLKCGDIISSKYTHDFKTCSCGNLSVDGGLDYIRRDYKSDDYIELNESIDNELNYDVDRRSFSQKDFNDECCSCNSKNILLFKGDGEYIKSLDYIGYRCDNCKKIYVFKDIEFK